MTDRPKPSPALSANPVIAVLRAPHANDYAPVIDALLTGGIRSIELTLSTQGTFDALPDLSRHFGKDADIGVGTVTTPQETHRALDSGAAFLVSPAMDMRFTSTCAERSVPVFPGGLTPSELLAGWQAGATAVKIFPASLVGPGYLSQLRGPFPDIQVIPSGGIDAAGAAAWIKAGALAVSLGGPLLQDAFAGGSLSELTRRAHQVTALVAAARSDQ